MNILLHKLLALSRTKKRAMMLCSDVASLFIALWLAFILKAGIKLFLSDLHWFVFPAFVLISIPIFIRFGLYRSIVRYMDLDATASIFKAVTVSVLLGYSFLWLLRFVGVDAVFSRSVMVSYWLTLLMLIFASRTAVRWLYQVMAGRRKTLHKIAIYGAGITGAQLATVLQQAGDMEPVAFFDDRKDLHGSELSGIRIYSPHKIESLLSKLNISQVILAMPSISLSRRKTIMDRLARSSVRTMVVPNLVELASGAKKVQDVREIEIADLLGREVISADKKLLENCIRGKSVLVTGAGGSIGSELCRQIICLDPKKLILLERAEYALYLIEEELKHSQISLIPVLGCVLDQPRLENLLSTHQVNTVYHAAAYKHVHIVENNPIEGVKNNILGTLSVARASLSCGVEKVVFISTDKAVRPTSVMGASKRFAELILQGLSRSYPLTQFCMVRFGNVLDSSGSVVPIFRQQIQRGGPVTVTHPQVTRYFMTIPEAVQLVLQAGSLGNGGDVYVLDMGKPVKIYDLARKMIHLSGFTIQDDENPNGDIQIQFTGLRPGEKLFEELLISEKATGTEHPMIMRESETELSWEELEASIRALEKACAIYDVEKVIQTIKEVVRWYVPMPHTEYSTLS